MTWTQKKSHGHHLGRGLAIQFLETWNELSKEFWVNIVAKSSLESNGIRQNQAESYWNRWNLFESQRITGIMHRNRLWNLRIFYGITRNFEDSELRWWKLQVSDPSVKTFSGEWANLNQKLISANELHACIARTDSKKKIMGYMQWLALLDSIFFLSLGCQPKD